MSICLLIIDDGREDYLERCRESIAANLPRCDHEVMIFDPDHELGFAGAVQRAWAEVLKTRASWVFHLESDFTLDEPVELERMRRVLRATPHLTQMSLLRQAWNDEERAAAGIIPLHPEDYIQRGNWDLRWIETRRFLFTTNPSLYSTELCRRGFPDAPNAEGRFGGQLGRERPEAQCGIWGRLLDHPRVTHIGETRAGRGY